MYRVCVPIINNDRSEEDISLLAQQLKNAEVDAVFVVFERVLDSDTILNESINSFIKTVEKFKSFGFNAGAWICPTIGYGGRNYMDNGAYEKYTKIVTDKGTVIESGYCPLDDNFTNDFIKLVTAIAKTGVPEIMFEDDFSFTGGKKFREHGCCCDKHIKALSSRLGENITREFISEKLYSKDGIKYRKEFLKLMGKTLADFTIKIEKAIHSVNPKARIGLAANASSYKMEGISFGELVKLTAGETKPFARMTGAPYWNQIPTFASNIEAIRLQTYWLKDTGAELITEGDVYPRPRHWVPSSLLEAYDMILRADGHSQGILKYMTDYDSKADYETVYIDKHIKNKRHYEEIERRFAGKETVGLNIVESINTFEDAEFGEDVTRDNFHAYIGYLPLISQWFTVDNSIPTAYGQKNCASLVFGENARYIDEETLKNGVIIDFAAAKILMKKGIDVGVNSWKKVNQMPVEHFCDADDYTVAQVNPSAIFYELDVKDTVEIQSEFLKIDGNFGNYSSNLWKTADRCPACYYYENDKGYKFVVYSFVAEVSWAKGIWEKGLFRNYYRQAQICKCVEKLQGRRLPAMCFKNPELYILCKKDENSMAVGLWNLFADGIDKPKIVLDNDYSKIDFYNCSGKIDGNVVTLNEELTPYSFALFTVYK